MTRIIVLGGGFGGVAAVQWLDRAFRCDDTVEILLVSNTNFLDYTPMLADVAGGTIEPRHAVPALRVFLKKARLRVVAVTGIDVGRQTVQGNLIDGTRTEIRYDYLIIGLGTVTNFSLAAGASEHALGLKDLLDAILLRNRALAMLEWANTTHDPQLRRELLTFVMAGGGFSGVECIAAIEDLLRGALRYYPDIHPDELRFILASLDQHLLSEVDERLGAYVLSKFRQRRIEVRLGVGVSAVTERSASLTTGDIIPTRTVIWTGGVRVNPVLQGVNLPKNRRGALQVNRRLQVIDSPHIFAVGDCAAVPLPKDKGFYTPTAQNALRQGTVAAQNVATLIRGSRRLKSFSFRPIGSLASLGQRQAIAEIGNLRISGLPAWLAWRAIYLAKMPTLANKVRVGLDWIKELITPVDTVQLPIMRETPGELTSPVRDAAGAKHTPRVQPAAVKQEPNARRGLSMLG